MLQPVPVPAVLRLHSPEQVTGAAGHQPRRLLVVLANKAVAHLADTDRAGARTQHRQTRRRGAARRHLPQLVAGPAPDRLRLCRRPAARAAQEAAQPGQHGCQPAAAAAWHTAGEAASLS